MTVLREEQLGAMAVAGLTVNQVVNACVSAADPAVPHLTRIGQDMVGEYLTSGAQAAQQNTPLLLQPGPLVAELTQRDRDFSAMSPPSDLSGCRGLGMVLPNVVLLPPASLLPSNWRHKRQGLGEEQFTANNEIRK